MNVDMYSATHGRGGQHTLLDTHDLDEAREQVGAAYCAHRLDVLRQGKPFHAVQREATCGSIAVHRLEYGATMLVDPVPLGSWILASSPLRGRLLVRSGRHERTVEVGESVVLDPFRKFTLCFDNDCELRTIRFDRHLVERVLGDIDERGAYRRAEFGIDPPGSARAATLWSALSTFLEQHAIAGDTDRYPLLSAELERAAVAAMAETHPLQTGDDDTAPPGQVIPAALRRVIAYIEAEPERPFCTGDLAITGGMSARALQEVFKRHFNTTPLGYVRQVRLRCAHEELAHAQAGTTVTDVAYRWGFGNLGRFARRYAQEYGCLPSETLRR